MLDYFVDARQYWVKVADNGVILIPEKKWKRMNSAQRLSLSEDWVQDLSQKKIFFFFLARISNQNWKKEHQYHCSEFYVLFCLYAT